MNVFILDYDPVKAAQYQCDKHVVKMAVESAQMLSTAHRLLDGHMIIETVRQPHKLIEEGEFDIWIPGRKRNRKHWKLDDEREHQLMRVAHANHPCNIWTRMSSDKYKWHLKHLRALLDEYTYRYGKVRDMEKYYEPLTQLPKNIPDTMMHISIGGPYHPFAIAIGEQKECLVPGRIDETYRRFYFTKRNRFDMRWTRREKPEWFVKMENGEYEYCD